MFERRGTGKAMANYDLAIIGGGIHGCGIARDAAGRGLSVLLVEQGDIGSATSSASTKLIHGGLRYLEHFKFRLVRESIAERERLLKLAPHLVRPMRFVLPHVPSARSALMLRLGFALYDWIGGHKSLPRSRVIDLADDPAGAPLKPGPQLGFEFSDCVVDDARLVIANAIGAREKGAVIRTRTRCAAARREGGRWHLILQKAGGRETATARALVNASGPWSAHLLETVLRRPARVRVRLVKGSHIVVPRLHAHDRAYLMQNDDQRLVFAIPFAGHFTLIGTTEIDVAGDPTHAAASAEEILYLCRAANAFFRVPVEPSKVKWTFAGVRALVEDDSTKSTDVSRDYVLEVDGGYGEPPLVSVFGGKLTTYRSLAEKVVSGLRHWFVLRPNWTGDIPLPGGDFDQGGIEGMLTELRSRHPFLTEAHARRWVHAYGTRVWKVLDDRKRLDDLGPRLVGDLYATELDYLRREEWASTTDDVLWRRTKLGLIADAAELAALKAALGPTVPAETLAG
jgi:glycerol-3-phosphate dehydrogenase